MPCCLSQETAIRLPWGATLWSVVGMSTVIEYSWVEKSMIFFWVEYRCSTTTWVDYRGHRILLEHALMSIHNFDTQAVLLKVQTKNKFSQIISVAELTLVWTFKFPCLYIENSWPIWKVIPLESVKYCKTHIYHQWHIYISWLIYIYHQWYLHILWMVVSYKLLHEITRLLKIYPGKNTTSTTPKSCIRTSLSGLLDNPPTLCPIPSWIAAINSDVGFWGQENICVVSHLHHSSSTVEPSGFSFAVVYFPLIHNSMNIETTENYSAKHICDSPKSKGKKTLLKLGEIGILCSPHEEK